MKYYPIELHTHTIHSDGSFEVEELIKNAVDFGYSGFFLTDHNTMSAHDEVINKEHEILIMKGVEWTTFNGHMLVLGCTEVGDWTKATVDNIDECIVEMRESAGNQIVIGVAHPFAIGNPICTGCNWEYKVEDWNNIDFIEIYNSANPQEIPWNDRAYEFWVSMLNKGYRLPCTSGRDWHRDEGENSNVAITYIGIEGEFIQENVVASIASGRTYTTLYPYLEFQAQKDGQVFTFGDEIPAGDIDLKIYIDTPEMKKVQDYDCEVRSILIYNNKKILVEEKAALGEMKSISLDLEKGNLRIEILGKIKGKENVKLLISSPIYIF